MFTVGPSLFYPGAPPSAPETPLVLNSALWLDATDSDTIAYNATTKALSSWTDKSGNGRNVVPTVGWPSGSATYLTSAFSQGAVRLGRGSLTLGGPSLIAGPTQTFFAVIYTESTGLNEAMFFLRDDAFSSLSLSTSGGAPKTARLELKATNNSAQSAYTTQVSEAMTNSTKAVLSVRISGSFANPAFRFNGNLLPSSGPSLTPVSNAYYTLIGANSSSSIINWQVAEMVYFNAALTDTETLQMTDYLKVKHGII